MLELSSEYILYGTAAFTLPLVPAAGRTIADVVEVGVKVGKDIHDPLAS
tara:strand:+ start:811 stop:957 length:147 start_codon:yes stop_codon:yes gene_type:complete